MSKFICESRGGQCISYFENGEACIFLKDSNE